MLAILVLSLVAACAAVPSPRYGHHGSHFGLPRFHPYPDFDPFDNDFFDNSQSFWTQMADEFSNFGKKFANFNAKFKTQGIEGNQYKVFIHLKGFEEKDIVVKAREGLLMVHAVHKSKGGNGENNYTGRTTLPSYVNVTGSWTYENNVLKIVFPLKPDESTEDMTELEKKSPLTDDHSREEMSPNQGETEEDIDVRARGNVDPISKETLTNEIPENSVELEDVRK